MLKHKRFLTLLLISLFIGLFLGGCSSQEPEEQQILNVRVNEVIRSPFYAPQYVALSLGFFAEENLQVELVTSWDGGQSIQALLENSTDIALVGTEAAIQGFQQSEQAKIIPFALLTQREGSFLVAREPVATFKWEDVRNKVIIGGRKGSAPQVIMEYLLKKDGLIPQKEVEIIHNIPINSSRGAFMGGIGDYVQLLEPALSLLEQTDTGHLVSYLGQSPGILAHTSFMATEEFIANNEELLQRFTNGLYKAQIWCANQSAEEIARVIQPFFPELEPSVILQGVKRYQEYQVWSPNPLISVDGLEKLQEIMHSVGELEELIPYGSLVNSSFAENSLTLVPLPAKK